MKIITDNDRYDGLQLELIYQIIKSVRSDLLQSGVAKEEALDMAGDISFSIACMLDSSTIMEHKGKPLSPALAFYVDDEGEEVLFSDQGSYMHETVHGFLDQILDEDKAASDLVVEDETVDLGYDLYTVVTTFSSGIKSTLHFRAFQKRYEFLEEIGEDFYLLTSGKRKKANKEMREKVIRDMCAAFSEITSIEFFHDDKLMKRLTEPGLELLSIENFGIKIFNEFRQLLANNKQSEDKSK